MRHRWLLEGRPAFDRTVRRHRGRRPFSGEKKPLATAPPRGTRALGGGGGKEGWEGEVGAVWVGMVVWGVFCLVEGRGGGAGEWVGGGEGVGGV
jgi:hypothetical protein